MPSGARSRGGARLSQLSVCRCGRVLAEPPGLRAALRLPEPAGHIQLQLPARLLVPQRGRLEAGHGWALRLHRYPAGTVPGGARLGAGGRAALNPDAGVPSRTDTDECLAGGACPEHADCTNFPGGFNCSCRAGFEARGAVCAGADAQLALLPREGPRQGPQPEMAQLQGSPGVCVQSSGPSCPLPPCP